MKNLLYKELKLSMHPLVYVFVFAFPLMVLIPNYPLAIGFIYVITAYPVLFLGANKGVQSNDIVYSCLLPIRKRDVVKARMMTLALIHFATVILAMSLAPLSALIRERIISAGGQVENAGIGPEGIVSLGALMLVGYSALDLVFLPLFYRNGRSIVLSTLLGMLTFATFVSVFTIALPLVSKPYMDFFAGANIGIQFVYLAVGLGIYLGIHFLTYRISSSLLEKVDF